MRSRDIHPTGEPPDTEGNAAATSTGNADEPRHTLLDRTFAVSLILKGLDGILELIGGVLLLVVSPQQIGAIIQGLTQHELSEDPHDLIANALLRWTGHLSLSASLFAAVYLLLHGLVKVVLVWAVLTNHLWAYPWMIAFLLIFIAYQSYELVVHFSWWLVVLTAFDIFIVYLTWREYGLHRARKRNERAHSSTESTRDHLPSWRHQLHRDG